MCEEVSSDMGPKCPYCGHEHSEAEDWRHVISIWGREWGVKVEGPVDYKCSACGLVFPVRESVSRTWESRPIVQEAAKP